MIQGIKLSRGNGIERGAWSKTVTPSASMQTFPIPEGNHSGEGQLIVLPIPDTALSCRRAFSETLVRENDANEYTSEIRDLGNNKRKGIFACANNMKSFIVEGSDNRLTWSVIVRGSTNGSNTGPWGTPSTIYASDITYRYFRVRYAGYNNGWQNLLQWGIFTS